MSNLVIAGVAAGMAFLIYEFTKSDSPDQKSADDSSQNNSSTQQNGTSTATPPPPINTVPVVPGPISTVPAANPIPAIPGAKSCGKGLYWVPNAPTPWGTSGASLVSDINYRIGGKDDELVTYSGNDQKYYWRQLADDCQ